VEGNIRMERMDAVFVRLKKCKLIIIPYILAHLNVFSIFSDHYLAILAHKTNSFKCMADLSNDNLKYTTFKLGKTLTRSASFSTKLLLILHRTINNFPMFPR